ncbi:hypothetical protein AB0L63_26390 [Nocardia sp. NPDC051990]|uniref:hypothetical protein n=1 Tax=Nocardia sp. NPDC051990 TaxID=3155285 RepID=UPI003431A73E
MIEHEAERNTTTCGRGAWVILDSPEGREFCSVVCRLDAGVPTAAYVLAPELRADRTPIAIHWSGEVVANGQPAKRLPRTAMARLASVIRSKDSVASRFETDLADIGCAMKVRTTSQTLDMVRTCIDLSMRTQASEDRVVDRRSPAVAGLLWRTTNIFAKRLCFGSR